MSSVEEFIKLRDGTSVWSMTIGTGLPMILLNGGPGMADYLGPVAELLSEQHVVHRYEQRGCGRTKPVGPLTLSTFISDIEELRNHWGYEKWFVVGHSWGVDLALAYAIHHPQSLSGLVGLSGGRVHNDRDWKRVYDENKHCEEMPPAAYPHNQTVNKLLNEDWKAFCRRPELLARLAHLETATMFLYGEKDIRPSWPTEQLGKLLPNAEFTQITGADHNLWQGNPSEVKRRILDFTSG